MSASDYPAAAMPWPRYMASYNGKPAAGGKVHFYYAGTTTRAPSIGVDALGAPDPTNPNPNPIILDAGGFADIWVDDGPTMYRMVVTTADDQLIYTADNMRFECGAEGPSKGKQGVPGEQGVQGETGFVGPRGRTGAIGPKGPDAEYGSGEIMWRKPGTYSFRIPAGVTGIFYTIVGGGGGGCIAENGNNDLACPRGGDGGSAGGHGEIIWNVPAGLSELDAMTLIVGGGGVGGPAPADGQDSYLLINGAEVARAKGGKKGVGAQYAVNPCGAQAGGIGGYYVFGKKVPGNGSALPDLTVPLQIFSFAGEGGTAATGPWGQGGRGGRAGVAPAEPVTVYSEPLMSGGDGENAIGNGAGGGGGGGGAVYAYGVGTASSEAEIPAYSTMAGGQMAAADCHPVIGFRGKGGNGAPGIILVKYLVQL